MKIIIPLIYWILSFLIMQSLEKRKTRGVTWWLIGSLLTIIYMASLEIALIVLP
jgi:hypothetical protein